MATETVQPIAVNSFPTLMQCKYYILLFIDITTTNLEIKTDRKGDKENPQETRGYSLIADEIYRILVISSGALLSLLLLLLIGGELVKLRRSEISNASDEMTEFESILCENRMAM